LLDSATNKVFNFWIKHINRKNGLALRILVAHITLE